MKAYLIRIVGGEVFTVELTEAVISKKELTKKKLKEIVSKELVEEDVKKLLKAVKMGQVSKELEEYGEFRIEIETGYVIDDDDYLERDGRILRESKWTRVVKEGLVEGYCYVKKYYKQSRDGLELRKEVVINPLLLGLEIYELD